MQPEQVGGQTLKGLTPQSGTQPGEKVSGIIIFEISKAHRALRVLNAIANCEEISAKLISKH